LDWALPRGVSVLKGAGESKAAVENKCERRNGFDPAVEPRKNYSGRQLKVGLKRTVRLGKITKQLKVKNRPERFRIQGKPLGIGRG
jgi:hypothetical protein